LIHFYKRDKKSSWYSFNPETVEISEGRLD